MPSPWITWNVGYTTSATITVTGQYAWEAWNRAFIGSSNTIATTGTQVTTWTHWNNQLVGAPYQIMDVNGIRYPVGWYETPFQLHHEVVPEVWYENETKEERDLRLAEEARKLAEAQVIAQAAAEQRRLEREALYLVQQAEQAKAKAKAEELLGWLLTDEQKKTMEEHKYIEVLASNGRRFRIRTENIAGNVDLMPEEVEDNIRLASYCAHPPAEGLPYADHWLAQKLALETDADRFLNVAYLHYVRDGYGDLVPRRDVGQRAEGGNRRAA